MRSSILRNMCMAAAIGGLGASVNAQSFNNGNFETGTLSSWTVVNTSNGVGAPGTTEKYDIDGPGPSGVTWVARFSVGQLVFTSGVQEGIEMTQSLNLTAGVKYTINYDWSTRRETGVTNAAGGVFNIIVGGTAIATFDSGTIGGDPSNWFKYGNLSTTYTPAASGPVAVGARITRPFLTPGDVFQLVDNFDISGGGGGGGDLLAVAWGGNAYKIDPATGTGSLLGATGFTSLNSMAKDSGGTHYAAAGNQLVTIDPNTGVGTLQATMTLSSIRGMAFNAAGRLYVYNDQGFGSPDILYTVNVSTGASTLIGPANHNGIQGMAFRGGTMYAWDVDATTQGGLLTCNLATGATTNVNPASGTTGSIQTLAFKADGTLLGGRSELYTVNLTTGLWALIGSGGYSDVRGMETTRGGPPPFSGKLDCPIGGGKATLSLSDGTPNGKCGIVASTNGGGLTIPGGPCAGTIIATRPPFLSGFPITLSFDGSGDLTVAKNVPAGLCGVISVSAVDLTTCDVVDLP